MLKRYTNNFKNMFQDKSGSAKDKENSTDDIMDTLKMTAKEMKEMILKRKKKDPRKEKRKDMKIRVEMVEAM